MLVPVRPEAVLPGRAFCLPTFSHFLIVNKTSFPLSLHMQAAAPDESDMCTLSLFRPKYARVGQKNKKNEPSLNVYLPSQFTPPLRFPPASRLRYLPPTPLKSLQLVAHAEPRESIY